MSSGKSWSCYAGTGPGCNLGKCGPQGWEMKDDKFNKNDLISAVEEMAALRVVVDSLERVARIRLRTGLEPSGLTEAETACWREAKETIYTTSFRLGCSHE